jgi:anaerobic selenocysteine-containing dehydrogenase
LLIAGGSPLTAFPQPERLMKALRKLDVLAVFDVVSAPLTEIATHVLPALGQLERTDVVFWNGRIALAPAAVKPGAGRQPAWRAYARIAKALGVNDFFYGLDADTATETEVLTAITANARYDFPTPVAAGPSGLTSPAKSNWVANAVLPEGRWRVAPPPMVSRLKDLVSRDSHGDSSLVLVSRRQTQHTSSTQYIRAARRYDRPSLLMGADDAASHGVVDGQSVRVTSAAGSVSAVVEITGDIRAGVVSLPHGWFSANAASLVSGRKGDVDPLTAQPQMSGIPVTIEAIAS